MERVSSVIGTVIVAAAALYLLTLGGRALIRPESTERFLGHFATTRRIHFTELALRVLTGAALVPTAPQMAFGQGIALFGWMLPLPWPSFRGGSTSVLRRGPFRWPPSTWR